MYKNKCIKTIVVFLNMHYNMFCRCRGVAQVARVLAWGARGRWFKSSHSDQQNEGFAALQILHFSFKSIAHLYRISDECALRNTGITSRQGYQSAGLFYRIMAVIMLLKGSKIILVFVPPCQSLFRHFLV